VLLLSPPVPHQFNTLDYQDQNLAPALELLHVTVFADADNGFLGVRKFAILFPPAKLICFVQQL
jgi:hypothetical protein